jgi:hypothetical protein
MKLSRDDGFTTPGMVVPRPCRPQRLNLQQSRFAGIAADPVLVTA